MDHKNPDTYRFDDYLVALGENWFREDPILERWLERSALDDRVIALIDKFGTAAATTYRELTDVVERRENLPYIADRGAFNRGGGKVVLPAETWRMLGDIHGSGLWRQQLDERARYAIVYLINQNGEGGVTCSTACTDGMLRALRTFSSTDERSRDVIRKLENATPEAWIHGAQFVTEIQGGSDAATNAVVAKPIGDGLYELSGQKWFCSNLTADYWMVTGRTPDGPADHRGVGLFCVPKDWEGAPNGYEIERLKDKLGTRALPTAEIRLTGARGWPVGEVNAGLKNMVSVVLTTSRIHNTIHAAASARRAAREAVAYADFRRAFGRKLGEHPLLADSLSRIIERANRTEAGAFATVDVWVDAMANPSEDDRALWARVLISLSKAVTARRGHSHVYEAMMVMGGNGIEERFSVLPRLWRDAAIMETWEGPYTLLLMQAYGDLAKYGVAGREEEFLRYGLGDFARAEHIAELREILTDPRDRANVLRWGELAPKLYRAFEDRAVADLVDDDGRTL
jgi:alkylation response protein AidB-like acyl-CoA dehydrogenase